MWLGGRLRGRGEGSQPESKAAYSCLIQEARRERELRFWSVLFNMEDAVVIRVSGQRAECNHGRAAVKDLKRQMKPRP